ncbi:MAG: DUF1700 domain-containing protein [Bdellovibrionaceae bacterium]|nr:DUF1700 domain-containing protein [Pseudobdellovibrionaceae bacterium]
MNQQEYMTSLKSELAQRNVPNIQDIVADYEEHFTHALKSGKSEDQVIDKLGAPDLIAKAYETESKINQAKVASKEVPVGLVLASLGRVLILAPFNFIFMFIPAIIIFTMIAAGWSVAGGIGAAGFAMLAIVPAAAAVAGTFWASVAALFMGFGTIGMAGIGVLIMYFVTKGIAMGVVSYVQWNLKFILQK